MRVYSITKIEKVKDLRRNGYSINEIVSALGVPKTTVWRHIRNVVVKDKFLRLLESKRGGSRKRKLEAIENSVIDAKRILTDKKDYAYVLSMLYWAEGNKKEFVFTNTDPVMIKAFLTTARECLEISRRDFIATIRYFTGMNKNRCLKYWSDQLEINKNHIRMYYNDGYTRGKSPYGMCRLTIKRGGYSLKVIRSMIFLIASRYNQ